MAEKVPTIPKTGSKCSGTFYLLLNAHACMTCLCLQETGAGASICTCTLRLVLIYHRTSVIIANEEKLMTTLLVNITDDV